jgi:hypothetical protein
MTCRLNVLVLESDPGAATTARRELAGAGHTVRSCHEQGCGAFPCNALRSDRTCPLAGEPIDVALDVRHRPRTAPTAFEDGVTCAIREHVPLVVAGPVVFSPFEQYATEMHEDMSDVVAACERAAAAPLARHSEVAQQAFAATLERRSLPVDAGVSVYRRDGTLFVSIVGGETVDRAVRNVAAVRIAGALRALDTYARGIDVVFESEHDGRVGDSTPATVS